MKLSHLVVGAAVSLVVSIAGVGAQETPDGLLYVMTAEVKPGMNAQFEEFVKKVQGASRGAPERIGTFQRALGGSTNTYYFTAQLNGWSDLDEWQTVPEILVDAYGEAEAARLLTSGGEAMSSISTAVSENMAEFSSTLETPDPGQLMFALVNRTEVEPSLAGQYQHFLRRLKVAEEQAGLATIRRVSRSGATQTYTSVRLFNSHAERARWPRPIELVTNAFGEAEARLLSETQAEAVRYRETLVLRFRPDLSRMPELSTNQ